jgi:photosystem II stability/assembly factor-like uncharacterized protein
MITDAIILQSGTIVAGGLGGTLLVSEDAGRSFRFLQQKDRKGISALIEVGDRSIVAVGEFGVKKLRLQDLGI